MAWKLGYLHTKYKRFKSLRYSLREHKLDLFLQCAIFSKNFKNVSILNATFSDYSQNCTIRTVTLFGDTSINLKMAFLWLLSRSFISDLRPVLCSETSFWTDYGSAKVQWIWLHALGGLDVRKHVKKYWHWLALWFRHRLFETVKRYSADCSVLWDLFLEIYILMKALATDCKLASRLLPEKQNLLFQNVNKLVLILHPYWE